jgi:hypothetical protein
MGDEVMSLKQFGKDAVSLTKTGVGLSALSSVDSSGAAAKMAHYMPTMGSLVGAKAVIGATKSLIKK